MSRNKTGSGELAQSNLRGHGRIEHGAGVERRQGRNGVTRKI